MQEKILKQIIYSCFYLILITPFLVWGKFLFPFITAKTLFFRILVEIALFFYILLVIYKPEYRPRFSKLTWLILIYLLFMTFASLFGLDPYSSFWGNIERGEGLLTIYHLFIFYLLITSLFKEKNDWLNFFRISIFVSLLISFYGLGQDFGWSFLLESSGGSRLAATLGNASYLAAYLLFNIFLCLFLFVNTFQPSQDKKVNKWRIFYGLAFLFEVYILFQTETRGALLGFLGGLLLLFVLSAVFFKNKKVKLGFIGLFLISIIFSGIVWLCRGQAWVINNGIFHRLTTISFADITTQSRLLGWQAAWQGWQDRFLFGYGYENYNVAFNKYFPVLIYRDPGSQIWFDRAHNIIFDQAVAGGVFALLAYLSILGWIIWFLLIKAKKNPENSLGFFILISLLAAYFVQNFFVFDILSTYILFYSFLGFITFLSQEGISKKLSKNKSNSRPSLFLIVILVLVLVWLIYIFNIKPATANMLAIKGLVAVQQGDYQTAMVNFKKALNYKTNQAPEIRQSLVGLMSEVLQSNKLTLEEKKENLFYAIEEIEKNLEKFPSNARQYLFAMTLYNTAGQIGLSYYNRVIELGNKALSLSPNRAQVYYLMGQASISRGMNQEGIDYFKKAIEINPKVIESHWNLASAYIILGEDELAEEEFARMKEIGFNYYSVNSLERLARVYLIKKDYQKMAVLYEEMLKLQPNSVNFYSQLAAIYKETGQIDKAREAAQKVLDLDADLKEEVELFLKSLEKKE